MKLIRGYRSSFICPNQPKAFDEEQCEEISSFEAFYELYRTLHLRETGNGPCSLPKLSLIRKGVQEILQSSELT